MSTGLQWVVTCVVVAIATVRTDQAKLIDLSHDHDTNTLMTPGIPNLDVKVLLDDDKFYNGTYVKSQSYSIGEHGGTHIDVPRHFVRDGYSLDKFPLEKTIADGVMIDCTQEVAQNPDYKLTLQKIKDWEELHGRIPTGAAVVVNFDWSKKFTDSSLYFSSDNLADSKTIRFPSVSEEAVDFLQDERDINILATDTCSSDLLTGPFPVHLKLLGAGKMLVENLKDPGRLPAKGFRFHATPVKFVGGTGVQVRAYARLLDTDDCGNGSRPSTSIHPFCCCSFFILMVALLYLFV